MSVVASVSATNYQAGARAFGPVAIPAGVTTISATFTREAWPLTINDTVLQVAVEASVDGGVTYPYGSKSVWFGGVRTQRDGSTATSETITRSSLPLTGTRLVRATVTVLSPLRTAVTLEVF